MKKSFKIRNLKVLLFCLFASTGTYAQSYQYINQWGSAGTSNGQFTGLRGIAFDVLGNVYVTDIHNNRIQKFNSSGTYISQWGTLGTGNGQFNKPSGICVDGFGNIYVTDLGNHRIQKFNSFGTYITQWGSYGSGNGQFNLPYDIKVDGLGNAYVSDFRNNRIQKFNSSGIYIKQWGGIGNGNGQLFQPYSIAIDNEGNLYITDNGNNRIQKFNSEGNYITQWGNLNGGSGDGQFYGPIGVATDLLGNVYVTDNLNYRVQKFTSSGTFITKWGSYGSGNGQFNGLWDIAVNSSGNVYVTDYNNSRVQVFAPSTIWNGSSWLPSNPNINTIATINGNYSTATNGVFVSKGLIVNAGKTLTVQTGTTLTVSGNLINNGTIIKCGTLNVTGTTTGTAVQVSTPPSVAATAVRGASCIFTLNATGATGYSWSPNTGLSATNLATVTSSAKQNIEYTVTGTGANGCTNTAKVTTVVAPISISPPTATFCQGGFVPLMATGAINCMWLPTTGLTPSTGPAVTAKPTTSGIHDYTVSGTDPNGCIAKGSLRITVNPNATFTTLPASTTICNGNSIPLNASNDVGFNYTWSPTTGINNPASKNVVASPIQTTLYTVSAFNPTTSCGGSGTVTVNVKGVISPPTTTICAGASTTLTASGADSYSWSPPTGLSQTNVAQVVANPTSNQNYTITGVSTGCPNTTASVTVNVTPLPFIDVTPSSPTVPLGANVTLTAYGSDNYAWNPGTYLNANNKYEVICTPTASINYIVSTTVNNCTATKNVVVNVVPAPVGLNASNPIAFGAGPLPQGTSYSDTKNNNPVNRFWNDYGQPSDDIFYTFTLDQSSKVRFKHCNSGISDSYMYILNNSRNLVASNDDNGPSCSFSKASIDMDLAAGRYYVVSEGYSTISGDITTEVQVLPCAAPTVGSTFQNPKVIATNIGACFTYTDIQNNACMGNEFGQLADDVFYKFKLNSNISVSISTCGSVLNDTYLTLLDSLGNVITSNDDYGVLCNTSMQASMSVALQKGTYYIVAEGYGNLSGNIRMKLSTPTVSCQNLRQGDELAEGDVTKTEIASPNSSSALNVYPNPSSGIINIDLNIPNDASVIVQDMLGQVVHKDEAIGGTSTMRIDAQHLAKGIYIVKVLGTKLTQTVSIK